MSLRGRDCCGQPEASCTPHCIGAVGQTTPPQTRIAFHGRTKAVLDIDGLDPGVAPFVEVLWKAGIDTYESCEGGDGHSYAEPAIRFHGDRTEGFWALHVAVEHGLPVRAIRRFWSIDRAGEPAGPGWEIAFREFATPAQCTDHNVSDCLGQAYDAPSLCPCRNDTPIGRGRRSGASADIPGCPYGTRAPSPCSPPWLDPWTRRVCQTAIAGVRRLIQRTAICHHGFPHDR
jgi:hypothetical protein